MSFLVKYWGVRGSLPTAPSPLQWSQHIETLLEGFFRSGKTQQSQVREYLASLGTPSVGGYGTATTCVDVRTDRTRVILDGGSGIKALGDFFS